MPSRVVKMCILTALLVVSAVFCLTAAYCRHRDRPSEYDPVVAVTRYHNVLEIGALQLRDGDRILVPHGEYQGLWRVQVGQWVRAEPTETWRPVTDLRTMQRFTYNGERWLSYAEEVLGVASGVLEARRDGTIEWREARGHRNLADGAYVLYQGVASFPATVLDGELLLPSGVQAGKQSFLLEA